MRGQLAGGLRGAPAVEHLSGADRVARGKDARAVAPLESHAEIVGMIPATRSSRSHGAL